MREPVELMNPMRGVDDDSGDYYGPSRGEQRREALAVLDLAHRLVEQPAARLAQMALADNVLEAALAAQKITAQIARKRAVGPGVRMQQLRQQLRQLVRNAREERLRNRPPHAQRELFRRLRALEEGDDGAAGDDGAP